MATDVWINLDTVGVTTQPFVVVATVVDDNNKTYIYYFEGTA